jgi:Holliday junction resolvase RusA-like endonuclease
MTEPLITITAYGRPAPQGSKRHVGGGRMVESSKALGPWRDAVKAAALQLRTADWTPLDGPLSVSMVFTFARPKSHYRTGRNAALLRADAPAQPQTAPDLSKLIRASEDALTDAGIWADDARVVNFAETGKFYAGDAPHTLTSPGAVIRIWTATAVDAPAVGDELFTAACRAYARALPGFPSDAVYRDLMADGAGFRAALAVAHAAGMEADRG